MIAAAGLTGILICVGLFWIFAIAAAVALGKAMAKADRDAGEDQETLTLVDDIRSLPETDSR